MLIDRLSCGLFLDFCDVLISCLDLTAPIHCEQVYNARFLHICSDERRNKLIYTSDGLSGVNVQHILILDELFL